MFMSPMRLSSPYFGYVAPVLDMVIVWFSAALTYAWYFGTPLASGMPGRYYEPVFAAAIAMVLLSTGIYRSWRLNQIWALMRAVATGWLATVLAVMTWMFVAQSSAEYSRGWFASWVAASACLLCGQRLLVYSSLRWLRYHGLNTKTLLLVGDEAATRKVEASLQESSWSGLRLVARVAPDGVAELCANGTDRSLDEVWLCIPMSDEAAIKQVLSALKYSTANIRLIPDLFSLKLINHGVSEVLGMPMLDLSATPMTGQNLLAKTMLDIVLSSIILVVISPLMLLIAILVRLSSPGPVIYRQVRLGWNGQEIEVYKFRTMRQHAEAVGEVTQARKFDPRVTRIGGFLRRTSLDELPQFINVLQGRMSIVGPRPHAVVHNRFYEDLVPGYSLRHKVKPGITGWAQIHGLRGETDTIEKMRSRVEYDLQYIENWSIWLDLKIIGKTAVSGWVHRNAY